jgi:hypothetical protein
MSIASSTAEEKVDACSSSPPNIEQQMQNVLEILEARSRGIATNEQVEAVVAAVLLRQPQASSSNTTTPADPPPSIAGTRPNNMDATIEYVPTASQPVRPEREIELDMEEYDDDENNDATTSPSPSSHREHKIYEGEETAISNPTATDTIPKRARGRPRKKPKIDDASPPTDWTVYEDVPLGKQGAQMMITFGDGKHPLAATVAATLQGARLMLQTAIRDARHVRRKQKAIYRHAKESLKAAQPQKPVQKEEWSTEILFRAAQGYDPLSYDPKCGFGIEEIQKLFPEEMNSYNRWNDMHSKATAEDKVVAVADDDTKVNTAATEEADTIPPVAPVAETSDVIGHLHERACQFDLRTTKMASDWYLKYAVLRQGSFLPRRTKSTTGVDAEWETCRKRQTVRGKTQTGVWAHMSAPTVRFLHWLGFDPTSALPPPSEEVTGALGFLGYDFFGRIVEKAILLRNLEVQQSRGKSHRDATMLIELDPGEQLTEADIDRAMQDPDIKPIPLYSSAPDKKLGPQLYFGPGFEDRLEMEMDEMLWSSRAKSALTEEERQIRQEEDELFSHIAKPPSQDGIKALLKDSNADK